MMKDLLVFRLGQITDLLKEMPSALALLGLGSCGLELERMDEYSDLDFFIICRTSMKKIFLEDVRWLGATCPIAYSFKNTPDGYKVMFLDSVYCEFAVFEPEDLKNIAFTGARILWQADDFDAGLCTAPMTQNADKETEWLLGEALTNIYVGMCRHLRGETLSAFKFIQGYALDRVLELIAKIESPSDVKKDVFDLPRRFEQRYPIHSPELSKIVLGYNDIVKSARNMLEFLDSHFVINAAIKNKILDLCQRRCL
ncbi:MAG: hypothetical protein N2376_13605 [Clostridia bacterium]|nr:hypothetical protein [Clostridia bacterium]